MNIEKLKKELFDTRLKELACLVNMHLFGALVKYFLDQKAYHDQSNIEDYKNRGLIQLKLAHDQYKQDRDEYVVRFHMDEMTPEISFFVD